MMHLAQIDKTQEETMGQFSGGMGGLKDFNVPNNYTRTY